VNRESWIVNHNKATSDERLRVLLIQQFFPAYRVPVFCKLAAHDLIELTLVHGTSAPVAPAEAGLANVNEDMPFRVIAGPIPQLRWRSKAILWFPLGVKTVVDEHFDVVIHGFATRWASLPRVRKVQQSKGGKFILWGIGFSQTKTAVLNLLRLRMVDKADALILYNERDRYRYIDMGADSAKLFVARNSIDLCPIDQAINDWSDERLERFRQNKGLAKGPVLLSAGRLAENKKLELLLVCAAKLVQTYPRLKVVLVGDGPHKSNLLALAHQLGLSRSVIFTGQVTKEKELAPWFLTCDLVVAPGQIGLLAAHAHAYGRPLVTSDNPAMYGPEIELVKPGETGIFCRYGDVEALATTVKALLADSTKRQSMCAAAFQHARRELGVPNMVNGVLSAISYVTGRSLPLFNN